jgi:hypothetical protein
MLMFEDQHAKQSLERRAKRGCLLLQSSGGDGGQMQPRKRSVPTPDDRLYVKRVRDSSLSQNDIERQRQLTFERVTKYRLKETEDKRSHRLLDQRARSINYYANETRQERGRRLVMQRVRNLRSNKTRKERGSRALVLKDTDMKRTVRAMCK